MKIRIGVRFHRLLEKQKTAIAILNERIRNGDYAGIRAAAKKYRRIAILIKKMKSRFRQHGRDYEKSIAS